MKVKYNYFISDIPILLRKFSNKAVCEKSKSTLLYGRNNFAEILKNLGK